ATCSAPPHRGHRALAGMLTSRAGEGPSASNREPTQTQHPGAADRPEEISSPRGFEQAPTRHRPARPTAASPARPARKQIGDPHSHDWRRAETSDLTDRRVIGPDLTGAT